MIEKPDDLDDWAQMLNHIYGDSQNYNRTAHEIHGHLVETVTIAAKRVTRHSDPIGGSEFMAKAFGWMVALYNKVDPQCSLETLILQKFPGVCPYCQETTCTCYKAAQRPQIDVDKLKGRYTERQHRLSRKLDDFQGMFRRIYEPSWFYAFSRTKPADRMFPLFARYLEEIGEMHEAFRFRHLYPSNLLIALRGGLRLSRRSTS
jgi:hypothetical protein